MKIFKNRSIYDEVIDKYDELHVEIYNVVEQRRLKELLLKITKKFNSVDRKLALDFGTGSGNLLKFFKSMGFNSIGMDVSYNCLSFVKKKYNADGFIMYNGKNINVLKNNMFDIVGIYSVLHHIDDYISTLIELYNKLKKGGILYIDHEANENYWIDDHMYKRYLTDMIKLKGKAGIFERLRYSILKIYNKKYQSEGDIHVFKDDHIEWDLIESKLIRVGAKVLLKGEYLLCRGDEFVEIYEKYKDKLTDMNFLVLQKPK